MKHFHAVEDQREMCLIRCKVTFCVIMCLITLFRIAETELMSVLYVLHLLLLLLKLLLLFI